MSTTQPQALHTHEHPDIGFLRKYVFSEDHKIIGIQFLFSGLIFLFIGGGLALLVRMQVGWPYATAPHISSWFPGSWGMKMSPEFYAMTFSMHATVMIFFVIIPLLTGAFGNFLIPLMIGARDMAFPVLNMMSYWIMWPGFILILASFFVDGGAAASGWTSYPTLASSTTPDGSLTSPAAPGSGMGQVLWLSALLCVGISSMMGSVNYITTIINMRAPGMTMMRMPMSIWAMFITAILQAMALPVLTVALFLQLLDKVIGSTFFLPPGGSVYGDYASGPGGGQPLLWQHLFWFYSHPAVYIMILPAMGMVSDIISTFARKPLFGYRPMVYAIAGIAGLGFIVWGHHMFQSGMDPRLGTGFMIATIMIALPSAVTVFNWLGTIWQGNIQYTTAMLNALAFVAMFVIGGLSGIFMAATPVDVYIHDTYFIVAHIHYVLFMSSIFGIFGAIYFWFPKMFGRMMDETWGKVHFVLTFVFSNCTFYPDAHHRRGRAPAALLRHHDLRHVPAPATAQRVHVDLRHPARRVAVHLRGELPDQPVLGQGSRPQPLAQQLAGVVCTVAAAARELRGDPSGVSWAVRVWAPRGGGGLLAAVRQGGARDDGGALTRETQDTAG
jgi:cytochrome c oxidase subunit 1